MNYNLKPKNVLFGCGHYGLAHVRRDELDAEAEWSITVECRHCVDESKEEVLRELNRRKKQGLPGDGRVHTTVYGRWKKEGTARLKEALAEPDPTPVRGRKKPFESHAIQACPFGRAEARARARAALARIKAAKKSKASSTRESAAYA